MARCMSIACILVPALRLRFRMMVSTVMFPMAEITISMLYVIMATMWPSLKRISSGRLDSSNMDELVTLSYEGLTFLMNTLLGLESIISIMAAGMLLVFNTTALTTNLKLQSHNALTSKSSNATIGFWMSANVLFTRDQFISLKNISYNNYYFLLLLSLLHNIWKR